jgi:RNA polymerase sigma-70 factor, ECF subfamily
MDSGETSMSDARPEGQPSQPSDAELMEWLRAGDREAFAELVDRHKDAVVGYLARLTGSRDRAEDLAQETFLRLYRSASGYVERGYLRAFLFRIATNLLRSEERRERRLRLLAPFLALDREEAPSAPSGLLRAEVQREVAQAIALLPMSYRVPLVLHELEGWSYADIAAELSCREGTVKSRIFRGRERLRRSLEPYWLGGLTWKTSE